MLSEDHAVQPPVRPRLFEFDRDSDEWVINDRKTVTVIHEFRRFGNKFVFHCHNASHEDHDMMSQFSVQGGIFVP